MSNVVQTLRERGLLQDITDPALEEICQREKLTAYIGFDPTSDSLHVGSMLQMIVLRHFQLAGHRTIAVVGGATGMIGDPSGRSAERNLLNAESLKRNLDGIKRDIGRVVQFVGPNAAIMANNYDWMEKFSFLDFLRDVGKSFSIGAMLAKDSVKRRLESEEGISFTEFSYQLLQAYDFKHLFDHHGCTVQAGGSDQWGNIVAGIDLIRRTSGKQAYGLTTHLLLNSQGQKMGKTADGAVWLNPEKLSPYEFFQYWVRQEDADVERFLKMLTFLPLGEIAAAMELHAQDPARRTAQKLLAFEVTRMVHGSAEAEKARDTAAALFGGGGALAGKSDAELAALFPDVPTVELPRADLESGLPMLDLLVAAKLASSKGDARRLVQQNAISVNNAGEPWPQDRKAVAPADLASPSMLLLRAGKKNYCLVRFV